MGNGKIEDLTFNGDGTKVYAVGFSGQMTVHSLSTPYDLSNATQDADDGINWTTGIFQKEVQIVIIEYMPCVLIIMEQKCF